MKADFIQEAIDDVSLLPEIGKSAAAEYFSHYQNQVSVVIKPRSQRVFLSTSYTGNLSSIDGMISYPVNRIVSSSPISKQDTAIIKIEVHDMPFLTLAPANSVHVQDSVTAISFPGDADTKSFVHLTDPSQADANTINGLLTTSVNSGQVTAQKTLSDGTLLYETDGIGSAGSSGGPVIDKESRIIGFIDAGSGNGRVVMLIPSDVVVQYVKQAGITSHEQGNFMTLWSRAIVAYQGSGSCHLTNAQRDMKSLREQYPQFGSVAIGLIVGGTIGTIALLAGLIFGIFFIRRRMSGKSGVNSIPNEYTPIPTIEQQLYADQSPYATQPGIPLAEIKTEMPPAPPYSSYGDSMPIPSGGQVRSSTQSEFQTSIASTPSNVVIPNSDEVITGIDAISASPNVLPDVVTMSSSSVGSTADNLMIRYCHCGQLITDSAITRCPQCNTIL
jgi:hypothetical protein